MVLHLTSTLLLLASGIIAGFLNATSGGGTLLIFPLLVVFGMDPIQANATSTAALIIGILGGIWGYRERMDSIQPLLRAFLPISIFGGLLGGILLTLTPVRYFDILVPYLILCATLLFAMRRFFVRQFVRGMHLEKPCPRIWILFLQLAISIYGGYFGAGLGILMLASLSIMGLHDLEEMNALKTLLSGAINLSAMVYFSWKGLIDWPVAILLSTSTIPGYYLGAITHRHLPSKVMHNAIVLIGLSLSALMFFLHLHK